MACAMRLFSRIQVLNSARALRWPYRVKRQTSTESAPQDFLDYEAICQNPPEHFNFARDILDQWSQKEKDGKRPSNPALWWVDGKGEEVRWSFEELGFLSRKAANVLLEHCNLSRGDRVVLILPRMPEWWLIAVGCIRTGIIFIPATALLTAKDIQYRLQLSKAKCIVTNDATAPLVDSIASECPSLKSRLLASKDCRREGWLSFHDLVEAASSQHEPVNTKNQEPISFYFTSGTTGYPKMVEHTCGSLGMGLTFGARHWMNLDPSSMMWGFSDTGWVKFVFSSLYSPWIQGSCVFSHSMPQFDPTEVLKTLVKYPVTTFCGTPTIFRMLLQQDLSKYKFKSLTTCVGGGEPLNPEVMERWKARTGLDIYEGYGQTESTLICATVRPMKIKPGFIGKPCPPYDVKIEFVQDLPKTVSGKTQRKLLRKKEWEKAQ
ncbi:hypothetical protein JRQ81_010200 [Phrynocephalus forsythii]|uniref:medium-chain acyl-CoA ligase n=1 Tax=Phrynocephalus forsythii TaxID=171643 RepID=A0A9Q1AR38_9SAUR|nr:hypothetical protein JRQ81_010200 [Phrynocephalus forsythii]